MSESLLRVIVLILLVYPFFELDIEHLRRNTQSLVNQARNQMN